MFTVVVTNKDCKAQDAFITILEHEGLKYETTVSMALVMTTSKGKCNPGNGCVVLTPESKALTDLVSLVQYINDKGLRKI